MLVLVLRDHDGKETFLNVTDAARKVGFNIDRLRYAGLRAVSDWPDGTDICGVTYPTEQQIVAYFGDSNEKRARTRLRNQTRQPTPRFTTIHERNTTNDKPDF